jgi:hypothetical protein
MVSATVTRCAIELLKTANLAKPAIGGAVGRLPGGPPNNAASSRSSSLLRRGEPQDEEHESESTNIIYLPAYGRILVRCERLHPGFRAT